MAAALKALSCRDETGYSLLEVSIVVVIASLLLAVGLTSYGSLVRQQREVAMTRVLSTFLVAARNTAVTSHAITVVCPTSDAVRCRNDSDWTEGWMMFLDNDGNRQPDIPEDVLRVESPPRAPNLRILSSSSRPRVIFLANGSAAGSNLTIHLCHDELAHAAVIVNRSGRTRVEKPTRADGCKSDL